MLEEMRDPGNPGGLVGRAGTDVGHVRDDRCALVGDDHQRQAVRKLELAGAHAGSGGRGQAHLCGQHEGEAKGRDGEAFA
jgi:hypothetical protein